MNEQRSKRRALRGLPAVLCPLLDAFALQLDLGAAAGRHPLLRTPIAIIARTLSTIIAFWTTSWVGRYLGLAWCLRTFQRGRMPPGS